jgi:hypothetical protein
LNPAVQRLISAGYTHQTQQWNGSELAVQLTEVREALSKADDNPGALPTLYAA